MAHKKETQRNESSEKTKCAEQRAEDKGETRVLTEDELENLRPGPIRHQKLDEFSQAWARNLFDRVGHVVYPTFEQWELGFLRDTNYRSEIMTWECIARTYQEYAQMHPEQEKGKLVGLICAVSTGAPQTEDDWEMIRDIFARHWGRFAEDPNQVIRQEIFPMLAGPDVDNAEGQ